MEPSINELSVKVEPGMKVGIVGRTGAGKSSILQALFRLSEADSGSITIDGVDITDIGLHLLRKNIAYIPQGPFLIQGTIRENLDPFNTLSNERLIAALKEVNLMSHIESKSEHGLETELSESNNLFSLG